MNILATILWTLVAIVCGLESIASTSPSLGFAWMLGTFIALGFAAGRIFNGVEHD